MTRGSDLAHHLFLYSLQAKNGFHIFKRLETIKRIFHENYLKPRLMSINKILLEYLFVYLLSKVAFTE